MNRYLLLSFFSLMSIITFAQSPNVSPNCRDLNAPLDVNGMVTIAMTDFVGNAGAVTATVSITRNSGQVIVPPTSVGPTTPISFSACDYRNETLKISVSNNAGACWSSLTLKQSNGPIIQGRSKDVYCFDSLVVYGGHIDGAPPMAMIPCLAPKPATLVTDWIDPRPCTGTPFSMDNDTVKIIYREYEAFDKDGNRGTAYDTITVFRLPGLRPGINVYCTEKDTSYCGEGNAGPYMVYQERCIPGMAGADQDGDGVGCDTLYFLIYNDSLGRYFENPALKDAKCGLIPHLDYSSFGNDGCAEQSKYVLEIKQECLPFVSTSCLVPVSPPDAFTTLAPGYLRCEFWLIDLDTLPPVVDCKDDNLLLTTVYTGTHECSAHTYVPPAYVHDDWSGVKLVKATIENIGTTVMTYNAAKKCYEGHTQFTLPHRVLPYKVLYEAYDSCHNLGLDSCYVRVKDGTRPIAIADKGVTVSLSDKKVWVGAETFDEGSWDNCGVNMLLARRTDWYDFCIDLCDSIDYCWVGEHGDTIWQSVLEEDKHLDEVEAHYAKTLEWLCEDNQACGDVIYNAWQYDLMKHATLDCIDHPYEVGEDYFRGLLNEAVLDPVFARKWKNPSTLFIGSANLPLPLPASADNDAFYVQMNGDATNAISKFPIWGATSDFVNKRILLTTSFGSDNGDQLYELPFGGAQPIKVGTITTDGVTPIRMDGLASKGDKLYGTNDNGTAAEGFYSIDLETQIATRIITYVASPSPGIGGIDTDPVSGKIYGADDGSRKIVEINEVTGSVLPIADYPAGVNDIDGVAVGNGKIFLVGDKPGFIYVYDLAIKGYGQHILSPFGSTDRFAGGAAYMPMLEDLVDEWSQIGGGWSDAVPFSCDDACGPITVEILVMDYWCNWSTAWTKVWVEDLTPVEVAKDVVEQKAITCKVYKENNYGYPGEEHPVSIKYIIDQAQTGEQDALDALDGIFGGYVKAWKDPYGNYVDSSGVEIECDIPFYDSICDCKKIKTQVRVYDDHLGYLWVDSVVTECFYDADTLNFQKGVVVVNCADNVHCEQEVWSDFDHCGQGYIFRKFKIWQGCPAGSYEGMPDSLRHPVDTIYRHQRIWVGNECDLDKYMFDVPYDTAVVSCNIEYGPDGNVIGDAGPENTGYPTYKFDDDCRLVGIAHEDKVFKIVGGEEACYKILRTWYFADWCGVGADSPGGIPDGKWWLDESFIADKCVQKIIVRDTVAPICLITGPVEDGGSVQLSACTYTLSVEVDAEDACGVISYYWELKDITKEGDHTLFDSGNGALDGMEEDNFAIASQGLYPGTYKLNVQIKDDCSNESFCDYTIEVLPGKKPTPVCITSLTATLTPWDSDGDGVEDSAHAVVWAEEYNQSSQLACSDDSLEYRIEFIGDSPANEVPEAGSTSLEITCVNIGTQLVRMWVISHPSMTADFCDAILNVQSDGSGCTTKQGTGERVVQTENQTQVGNSKSRSTGNLGINVVGDVGQFGTEGFTLEQNNPNPFQDQTQIGFTLPASMEASIEVFDVTGRMVKSIRGSFSKGYHTVQIQRNELQGTGVLYYRLQAENFTAMKRMIVIE